ncbi:MAG TPA: META domain-containing protein [Vicinamibacterales bacterium]|nr:META domain-containing protein [Vicinamibacterales bacterium]
MRLIALLFVVLLSGASVNATQKTTPLLEGRVWRLTHLQAVTELALAALTLPPTLRFDSGRVQAFTGCNSLTGSYSVDGDRLSFGKLVGTLMACAPPAMAMESAFSKSLMGTLRIRIVKNGLTLISESDSTSELVFVAEPPPSIEGVSWEVILLDNGRQALASPLTETRLTMLFKEGSLSGNAGCNTFQGKYTRQDNRLMIGPLAATRKVCAAEGVMDQERRFLAAIEAATSWAIEGDTLDLRRANATGLVRARQP